MASFGQIFTTFITTLISFGVCEVLPLKTASASSFNLTQTYFNPSPNMGRSFGGSVAISGDNLFIGGENGTRLFNVDGTQLQRFPFASRIAVDESNVLISDFIGTRGTAYLFNVNGTLRQTFSSPSDDQFNFFANEIAIDGSSVLIGALNESIGDIRSGAAYLFDIDGTLKQTFLNPVFSTYGDAFGSSVAIDGDYVLIGAPYNDTKADNGGVVYLFDVNGTLLQTFFNPTPSDNEVFGFNRSIAISEGRVLVGAFVEDGGINANAGAAYLFDFDGTLLQTFLNPTPDRAGYFGSSVAIDGNNILIGAAGGDFPDIGNFGSAYLFDATTGNLLQTFISPTPDMDNFFGGSIAIEGDKILIGEPGNDLRGVFTGAAYLYQQQIPESTSMFSLLALTSLSGVSFLKHKFKN